MTSSKGYRHGTRYKFAKGFRQHGVPSLGRYLRTFKRGDSVTIKADGAIHKGMPHSYYHGRTGVVFDVTKSSVGVEMNKRVGGRELLKRFHIRIEHVVRSACRDEFLKRRAENDRIRREAKKEGKPLPAGFSPKRSVTGPMAAKTVSVADAEMLTPIAFSESF